MPFIRLETFPPMLVCWVYFYCERVFDFYQIIFLHLLKWSYIFIFYSINTMYYINWFLAVKLTLNSCDKYHLVRLYNYFLLDSVFWYWGTFFLCVYIFIGDTGLQFSCDVFGFDIGGMVTSWNELDFSLVFFGGFCKCLHLLMF